MNHASYRPAILATAFAILCLASAPTSSRAAPDPDGAVKALAAMPADVVGNAVGGAGLVAASIAGFGANFVAALDNNTYSHLVLRGVVSTPLRRMALGLSRMSSGALEGFTNDDYEYYPQEEAAYMKMNFQQRIQTLRGGLGAIVLSAIDGLGDTGQFLLRLPGATDAADSVAAMQTDARKSLVGPAKDGAYDVEVYDFHRK